MHSIFPYHLTHPHSQVEDLRVALASANRQIHRDSHELAELRHRKTELEEEVVGANQRVTFLEEELTSAQFDKMEGDKALMAEVGHTCCYNFPSSLDASSVAFSLSFVSCRRLSSHNLLLRIFNPHL